MIFTGLLSSRLQSHPDHPTRKICLMPRIHLSNATLQQSWRRGFEARTHSKGVSSPVSNKMASRLKNDVRGKSNVAPVTVARPVSQRLDDVIWKSRNSGRGSCANTKTVTGIIARNTGGREKGPESTIDQGRRER